MAGAGFCDCARGAGIVPRRTWIPLVCTWFLAVLAPAGGWAQQPEVVLESIAITPAEPGRETLCRLDARVRNNGERAVYRFGFEVELNGKPLPAYKQQIFLQVIEAGASDVVSLYNFWTSETGRPAPLDGRLEVLVRLREAHWVDVSEIQEDGETIEVWTPFGEVAGLPQAVARTLKLK